MDSLELDNVLDVDDSMIQAFKDQYYLVSDYNASASKTEQQGNSLSSDGQHVCLFAEIHRKVGRA